MSKSGRQNVSGLKVTQKLLKYPYDTHVNLLWTLWVRKIREVLPLEQIPLHTMTNTENHIRWLWMFTKPFLIVLIIVVLLNCKTFLFSSPKKGVIFVRIYKILPSSQWDQLKIFLSQAVSFSINTNFSCNFSYWNSLIPLSDNVAEPTGRSARFFPFPGRCHFYAGALETASHC